MRSWLKTLQQRIEGNGAQGDNPAHLTRSDDVVTRLSKTHQEAAQRLTDKGLVATRDYLDAVVKTDTAGSHPDIVEFYRHFNKALRVRSYPFFAFEFLRTHERQNILFEKGFSKAKAGSSPHNFGCAVDVVHMTKFWDIEPKQWAVIGAIGKEVARKRGLEVVWGGDWDFYDPAHWEMANWRDRRAAERSLYAQGWTWDREDPAFHQYVDMEMRRLSQIG